MVSYKKVDEVLTTLYVEFMSDVDELSVKRDDDTREGLRLAQKIFLEAYRKASRTKND